MDERYDNVSLATRSGYVIAHELVQSLVTRLDDWQRRATPVPNYHNEALADLVSSLAIMHAGHATAQDVCNHVSQLWCARCP